MSDITKARQYLKMRGSKLQNMTSFGLMYNTAKAEYSDIRLKIRNHKEDYPGALSEKEVYTLVDFAVLNYLRKHAVLPGNVSTLFTGTTTLHEMRDMAVAWLKA